MEEFSLNIVDYTTIIIYAILTFGIAILFNAKHRKLEDYLIGKKSFNWFIIGFAIFSANIGAEHLVGLSESGYQNGFNRGNVEIMALLPLTLLGWLVAPYLIRRNIATIPEFIEKRYGKLTKWLVVGMSFLAYITTKISISLFAGAYLIHDLLGFDYYTSSLVLLIVAGVYTLVGGVRAVMVNGLFQGVLVLVSGMILTTYCLIDIGGWSELKANVPEQNFELFYKEGNNFWRIAMYTIVMLFSGIWYWCSDQYIIQRVMGAKSISDATRGTLFAGFLKLLVLFFFILPGVIAAYEFPDIDASSAYATLISHHVPEGVRGLIIVGVIAALMSSLAATFNTIATVFTLDVYRKLYPKASEFQLINVGQLVILAFMIFAIVWVPFVPFMSEDIFPYLRMFQFQLGLPLAIIVVLGMIWSRPNQMAALAVLMLSLGLGMIYIFTPKGQVGEASSLIGSMDLYEYYFYVIVICLIAYCGIGGVLRVKTKKISLLNPVSSSFEWTFSIKLNVIITVVLNACLISIWLIFN